MCGVTGVYHYGDQRPVDRAILDRSTDLLTHRGPDGRGVYVDGALGLGHRRLAILDLTEAGAQPMASACGRYVICYNGESYNHLDLKAPLLADGVPFRGHSDTETIVNHVARHGIGGVDALAGIFAFALWDRQEKTLWLVRDPVGVKQLYYHDDGTRIRFASEIKGLFADPTVPRRPDYEGMGHYFHFHAGAEGRTFFDGIHLLEAGSYLKITPQGITGGVYSTLDDGYTEKARDLAATEARLGETLAASVKSQLLSDVPVACFLSGGVDSTLVSRHVRNFSAQERLTAFGCYYDAPGTLNEEPYARQVADLIGIDLSVIHPTEDDFRRVFARALYHQDEPKIGSAMISMWGVSELAARSVKVCLGGQGGDELFGGYSRYAMAAPLRTVIAEIGRRFADRGTGQPGASVQKEMRRAGMAKRVAALFGNPFDPWERRFFGATAQLSQERLRQVMPDAPAVWNREGMYATFRRVVARCPDRDPMQQAMYWDRQVFLQGLFAQDDRMSMAHSLETRVPIADPRVVRLSFGIPPRWKMRGLASKWILKRAIADVVPAWVLNRQKGGFATPLRGWFAGGAAPMIRDLLTGETTRQRGLFDTAATARLLEGGVTAADEMLVWKLVNVELWHRIFIDGAFDGPPSMEG